jgi:hypothetical protein
MKIRRRYFQNSISIALTLLGRSADRVVISVESRQGDTSHGIRGRDDHRRGMAAQRHLPRLGTSKRRLTLPVSGGPQEKTQRATKKAGAVGRQLHWDVRLGRYGGAPLAPVPPNWIP